MNYLCENMTIFSIIFGSAIAIAGWFVGDRLAISRDKRREFNDAIRPIRDVLLGDIAVGSVHHIVSAQQIDLIAHLLSSSKADSFRAAADRYNTCKKDICQDSYGGAMLKDVQATIAARDDLLKLLIPR